MARRHKPKSPEQIAAERLQARMQDLASVELQPETAVLPSSQNIDVRRQGQQTLSGARRLDAFDALRKGMEIGVYDATRKLQRLMTIRRGEHDRGRAMNRVDGEPKTDRTDAMIAAAEQIDAIFARMSPRDAWLLTELICPGVETHLRFTTWREIVAYITGETHEHAQGAAVRSACFNLLNAMEAKTGLDVATGSGHYRHVDALRRTVGA